MFRFKQLNADPSKAKKPHHKPKNAKEFAKKYLDGFYSLIDNDADSKNISTSSEAKTAK
jgi:hypothetical protein